MKTSHRILRAGFGFGLLIVSILAFAQSSTSTQQSPSAEVTVVKAGAGPCTADFVVSDSSGKGIYDAKIRIQIRYRFMGLHNVDATVGTNYEGKARIEGLPEKIKGTAEFKVSRGDQIKSLPFNPLDDCHPHHEVVLNGK